MEGGASEGPGQQQGRGTTNLQRRSKRSKRPNRPASQATWLGEAQGSLEQNGRTVSYPGHSERAVGWMEQSTEGKPEAASAGVGVWGKLARAGGHEARERLAAESWG